MQGRAEDEDTGPLSWDIHSQGGPSKEEGGCGVALGVFRLHSRLKSMWMHGEDDTGEDERPVAATPGRRMQKKRTSKITRRRRTSKEQP